MKIWINRAGQNLGTFTLEEVQRGLDQGQFVPGDLAWQEGMETWRPLAEFPGLRMPPPSPPETALAPVPGTAGATGLQVGSSGDGTVPSWERRREVGLVRAYFATVREILFEPVSTFSRFSGQGSMGAPTGFLLLTLGIQALFAFGLQALTLPYNRTALDVEKRFNIGFIGILLLIPLALVLGVALTLAANFVLVGCYHLVLRMLGATTAGYGATYRVVTYSQAAQIFGIVPCIGPVAAVVLFLISATVGLQKVHGTERWKAAVALVVPYFLCFALLMLVFGSLITYMVHVSQNAQS